MEHPAAQLAALLLTIVFAWSGAAKVLHFRTWRAIVPRYRLPSATEAATIAAVPFIEGVVPVLFVVRESRAGAALALGLLAAFSLAVLRARRLEGDRLPCGCFGSATTRDYRVTILRNALLAIASAVVLMARRDVALFAGVGAPRGSELIAVSLGAVGVALIAWMLWSVRAWLRGDRS